MIHSPFWPINMGLTSPHCRIHSNTRGYLPGLPIQIIFGHNAIPWKIIYTFFQILALKRKCKSNYYVCYYVGKTYLMTPWTIPWILYTFIAQLVCLSVLGNTVCPRKNRPWWMACPPIYSVMKKDCIFKLSLPLPLTKITKTVLRLSLQLKSYHETIMKIILGITLE